jgi:hypothetical protein
MKSSNLAVRLPVDPPVERQAVARQPGSVPDPAPPRAAAPPRRATLKRRIVTRDQGLPAFRVC